MALILKVFMRTASKEVPGSGRWQQGTAPAGKGTAFGKSSG
jgi:hypothetical protein